MYYLFNINQKGDGHFKIAAFEKNILVYFINS